MLVGCCLFLQGCFPFDVDAYLFLEAAFNSWRVDDCVCWLLLVPEGYCYCKEGCCFFVVDCCYFIEGCC